MVVKSRRKILRYGNTKAISIPAGLHTADVGEYATLVSNHLILIDPTGEILEDTLLDFFEEEIEPRFWAWYPEWKKSLKESK